jgi:transcriptional regulator with XRE-family HTH domain
MHRETNSCGARLAKPPCYACGSFDGETMLIGHRLRRLREDLNLSQGDVQKRTGMLRSYISRIENGHTTPAVQTLEKFARALQIPTYGLFCNSMEVPSSMRTSETGLWGSSRKQAHMLAQFVQCLSTIQERDRQILLQMARKMANRSSIRIAK